MTQDSMNFLEEIRIVKLHVHITYIMRMPP